MTETERENWKQAVEPVRSTLFKTRKISYKIINSPMLLLPKWREQLAGSDFAKQTLLKDVATRWNSTHNMLESFLQLKPAVVEFLDRASNRLSEYVLTDEEWEVVDELVSVLQVSLHFVSLVRRLTCSRSCKTLRHFFLPLETGTNIASVIPAMDTINEAFASGILNENNGSERVLSEPIRHALGIGKRTLNKYYSLTDDSDLYCIAMGLSPFFSLFIFLLTSAIQSSTPPINWSTSVVPSGLKSGSTQL
ncbi:hypothetical protein FB446DRAFT_652718 [Lentinula raphanica]|nr:hypothetical protein FB446DRAFT_652718 [Lentinula raphanica]